MRALHRRDWILLLLLETPLDRIRLMKGLFLLWHRSGRTLDPSYTFTPFPFGPCSLDVYRDLEALRQAHLVSQPCHPRTETVPYSLTPTGATTASQLRRAVSAETMTLLRAVTEEVASLDLFPLAQRVRLEAPDFT